MKARMTSTTMRRMTIHSSRWLPRFWSTFMSIRFKSVKKSQFGVKTRQSFLYVEVPRLNFLHSADQSLDECDFGPECPGLDVVRNGNIPRHEHMTQSPLPQERSKQRRRPHLPQQ